ncbi:DUF4198 domain-containing protein [Tropicimonas sp. IMCC34043]|uniref:DUF4198 domain-containing protein n=1 Tax=Tropicimonas sp. IMCC34043 TaxID=2248760 RepID=UPI000E263997|nr:DUF4198 domain-containing protein [Tropicimonas sp. IMCC34043]
MFVPSRPFLAGTLPLALAAGLCLAGPAAAHFQLIYTPDPLIAAPGDVPVKLIFWHPFENGHAMDMAPPLEFFAVNRGNRTDLMDRLVPATFKGAENSAEAFDASIPVTRAGDYVVVVVAAPYYEQSEDIYIQQIAKSYLNRAGLPTDWMEPQGLKTEILPLNKPTNIIAGSTFSGRVLRNGEPVPGAEVEIEFMAAEPDMAAGIAGTPQSGPMPGGAVVAIADAQGEFTFGVPKAGYWGFAALGSGPDTDFDGKDLSQDAVLWIRAWEME